MGKTTEYATLAIGRRRTLEVIDTDLNRISMDVDEFNDRLRRLPEAVRKREMVAALINESEWFSQWLENHPRSPSDPDRYAVYDFVKDTQVYLDRTEAEAYYLEAVSASLPRSDQGVGKHDKLRSPGGYPRLGYRWHAELLAGSDLRHFDIHSHSRIWRFPVQEAMRLLEQLSVDEWRLVQVS